MFFSSNLDYIFIPGIRKAVEDKHADIDAYVVRSGGMTKFMLHMAPLTDDEISIILKGCLINYYASDNDEILG